MDEIIKRVTAYAGNEEMIDQKVEEGLQIIQEAIPIMKIIMEDDSFAGKQVIRIIKSAYASGLANGYKDRVIEEVEKENAK